MSQGIPPLLQQLPSTAILPGDVPRNLSPREWVAVGRLGRAWGLCTNRSRGVGWDGNGDEIGTEWVWDGVRDRDRDREEDVKRVEWDGNGGERDGMGIEVRLDGVGKGMR